MSHVRVPLATLAVGVLVAAGAFLTAWLGIMMTRTAGNVASLWIANAVLIAGLTMQPKPVWPWLVGAFIAANAAASVAANDPLSVGVGFGLINAFEAVVAAAIIRHRCGQEPTFESLGQMLCFAGAAGLLAPLVSATAGAGFVALAFGAEYGRVWVTWFVGDALGNLTLAPLLILLVQLRRRLMVRSKPDLGTAIRALWPLAGTLVTAAVVFGQSVVPAAFLTIPAALLAAFCLGPTGAALSAAIIIAVGGLATVLGIGPMSLGPGGMAGHILNFQLLVATVLSCTLPVAALRAERQALGARLRVAADLDTLTGLPNRRLLYERLDRLDDGPPKAEVGLLLVDLDRFKAVNDVHGHLVGDQLLRLVTQRLTQGLDLGQTAYRLGGDEFAVVCDLPAGECDLPQRMAARIVEALSKPFEDGGLVHHIGASVGIALFPSDATDRPSLLRRADIALYRAKEEGRGRACSFEVAMDAEITWRATIEEGLRAAIARDELRPVYQPIVDLASGRTLGFEMLARWPRSDGPSIGPDVFIRIAEEGGLINDLMFQLLARACGEARDWDPSLFLAVNIAPVQLKNPQLVEKMLAVLDRADFPPHRLAVEITETALIDDTDAARHAVEAFSHHGILVALDDFGTGYSSLHHLRTLPFDKIKIDRSFVREITTSTEAAKIVRAIIGLAASLELPVVAEGIESAAIVADLLELGCAEGQGYHYGAPMTAEAVSAANAARSTHATQERRSA